MTKIEKLSLEEYLGKLGLDSPISDFLIDKTRGNHQLKTQKGNDKFNKDADEARYIYSQNRKLAIQDYFNKVKIKLKKH